MNYFFSNDTQCAYIEGLHNDIPLDAKPISAEVFNQILNARSEAKAVSLNGSGALVVTEPASPPISNLKAFALRIINSKAAAAVDAISSSYPQFEIDTWDAQENEARAWLLDNNTATPTLTPIATARGLTIAELAERVIAKAEVFRPLVATIIGKRQALEDQLELAQLEADIADIRGAAANPTTWSIV